MSYKKSGQGDTESGAYILHVLYMRAGHGHVLASYTMDAKFMANCKLTQLK